MSDIENYRTSTPIVLKRRTLRRLFAEVTWNYYHRYLLLRMLCYVVYSDSTRVVVNGYRTFWPSVEDGRLDSKVAAPMLALLVMTTPIFIALAVLDMLQSTLRELARFRKVSPWIPTTPRVRSFLFVTGPEDYCRPRNILPGVQKLWETELFTSEELERRLPT